MLFLVFHQVLHLIADDEIKVFPTEAVVVSPNLGSKAAVGHHGHLTACPLEIIAKEHVLRVVAAQRIIKARGCDDVLLYPQLAVGSVNQIQNALWATPSRNSSQREGGFAAADGGINDVDEALFECVRIGNKL